MYVHRAKGNHGQKLKLTKKKSKKYNIVSNITITTKNKQKL